MESSVSEGEPEAQKAPKHSILSTLPRDDGWSSDNTLPLYSYEGFWYPDLFLEGILGAQELDPSEFNPSQSDVILCSCVKSGTTWLKALAFSIATRTRFQLQSKESPLFKSVPHDLIPFIEIDIAQNHTPRDPELPLLSTHMPFSVLPESLLASGCKFVYVCRNPKDVFVSLWYFCKKFFSDKVIPLEQAFHRFCQGISFYGPYWDHVLGYWKASLDHPQRILFLKYEDMMKDAELHVRRLAEFMGCPFSAEEEMEGVPKKIVEVCSFESLSNFEVNKTGKHRATEAGLGINNCCFFRKAKAGDWRNYLTEAMADKLDQITLDKLGKSGLTL